MKNEETDIPGFDREHPHQQREDIKEQESAFGSGCSSENVPENKPEENGSNITHKNLLSNSQASSFLDVSEPKEHNFSFKPNPDKFDTLKDVCKEIKDVGVQKCGLIIGIDYTLSNNLQGQRTFGGQCLHAISSGKLNPYQEVISILGETLQSFDDDGIIPAFGFGDNTVKDHDIFPLKSVGECNGFSEVLEEYNRITPTIKLGGPTNFAPLIKEAIEIVQNTKKYHILVIVADGQVETKEEETIAAIVEASNHPLSIIMIGVGDGPWDCMKEFDDELPERQFDNFQFVDFHAIKSKGGGLHSAIALASLMEIPDQFMDIKRLELLE